MTCDINPYRNLSANISPTEFELFCMDTLKAYASKEGLIEFIIAHNQKVATDDGIYQIDITCEYVALGAKVKVIIECKMLSRSIERDIVVALHGKLQSLGANKGILIATCGYQRGATHYAQKHGITLWQICGNEIKHIIASASIQSFEKAMLQIEVERYLPKYFVLEWDCDADYPFESIYPTEQMRQNAISKVKARNNI